MWTYEKLLDRLYALLPEQAKKKERFEIPKARVRIVGSSTYLENFEEIAKVFRRDPKHLYKFLTKELGTAGTIEGGRLRLKGKFGRNTVQKKIDAYAKYFVLCPVCGKPDTRIIKMRGVEMLKCEACGAISPLPEIL